MAARSRKSLSELFGSLVSQARVVELEGSKVVVKSYKRPSGVLKWLLATIPPASVLYPFEFDPFERMVRELSFFEKPPSGVRVPRVISANLRELELVREYVEGRSFYEDARAFSRELGRLLCTAHKQRYCLGDTKPSNFVFTSEGPCVVDAEQSVRDCVFEGHYSWDVSASLVFAYLSNPLLLPREYEELVEGLLEGYTSEGCELPSKSYRQYVLVSYALPLAYAAALKKVVAEFVK